MTEIYLIRHAQAEGNLYRIMQGHWNGEVTEQGRRQIQALERRFEGVHIDAVYASDLDRTVLTASAVAGPRGLPIRTEPALREINLGPWEAKFFGNLIKDEPERAKVFMTDPESWRLEGAETFAQVRERAMAALESIARRHEGQTVAVVSHGVTIRCLLTAICGVSLREPEKLPIGGNTAVSHLLWEKGRFRALAVNDDSHLKALEEPPWERTADLRDVRFDPASDPGYYKRCYADAWAAAHGPGAAFDPAPYYAAALEHHKTLPGSVMKILNGDEPVGLVDLDSARGAHAGTGWVSLLYLKPEYRRRGCGVQVLARAISFYGGLGRRALRLNVAEDNAAALAFYKRWGFETLGRDGSGDGLLLMEKKLGGHWYA